MRRISLVHAKADKRYKVAEISAGANLKNKLMHMGIFTGKEVAKLSHIGLRGPIVVKVGRGILALGHGVAEKIMVETE